MYQTLKELPEPQPIVTRRQKWSFDPANAPSKRGGSALTDGCGYRRCGGHRNCASTVQPACMGWGIALVSTPFVRQIALLLGLGIAVALCAFDYHVIARWCGKLLAGPFAVVDCLPTSRASGQAMDFRRLAQPSEFAKIATICSPLISSVALPMSCGRPSLLRH